MDKHISSAPTDTLHLTIVEGMHVGGSITLEPGVLLLVGSDEACDIILRDQGVLDQHIALMVSDQGVTVKSLQGSVTTQGERHELEQFHWPQGELLELTDSDAVLRLDVLDKAVQANNPSQQVSIKSEPNSYPLSRGWLLGLLLCLGTVLTLTTVLSVDRSEQSERAGVSAEQTLIKVTGVLTALQLVDSVEVSNSADRVHLQGVLTPGEHQALVKSLTEQNLAVGMNIISSDQLVQQVEEVFRANGYSAVLEYAGQRRIQISNLDQNHPKVKAVIQYVNRDVPLLKALTFVKPGYPDVTTADRAQYFVDQAKTLLAVVEGETAYITGQAGARYFIGSELPNGFTIKRIAANGVEVDRQGELAWLHF